jgi:hypothetical protein
MDNVSNINHAVKASFKPDERNSLVDNVKGLLVVVFLLAQMAIQSNAAVGGGDSLMRALGYPAWLWHGVDVSNVPFWNFFGFSFLDLGPISFFFVIGVIAFWVIDRRASDKTTLKGALKRHFTHNVTIVGLFLPLNIIASLFMASAGGLSESWNWGTIPSIILCCILY